jgi:hypothetical protein
MITTNKMFPMTKMKGFATVQQGQKRPRKNRVGSLLKRFVAHVTKERNDACDRKHSLQLWRHRKSFKREKIDSSYHSVLSLQYQQLPEILKVSPMCTSCEVTLISSVEDGPGTHQITVTHDGRPEFDNSYHMVLNPHRTSRSNYYHDDDEDHHDIGEIGSSEVTHDSTTNLSCSSGLNGKTTTTTTTQSFVTGGDNNEETIYFGDNSDKQCLHDRHNATISKDNIFYKSLFIASDTEDDDDDNEVVDFQFWENYQSWRDGPDTDHACYGHASELQKQELLNTTTDTALLEDEYDESLDSDRDEDLPIEITVQF